MAGLFYNEDKTNTTQPSIQQQAQDSSGFPIVGTILKGITNNPGIDAGVRTWNNAVNYLSNTPIAGGGTQNQFVGTKNQNNSDTSVFNPNTPIPSVPKFSDPSTVQLVPNSNYTTQPVNNPVNNIPNTPQVSAPRYSYTGPINTIFGSTPMGNNNSNQSNGNQFNKNTGGLMGNFNFTQDQFNQGLRGTSKQDLGNLDTQYRNRVADLGNGSFFDLLRGSALANQDRQMMRVAQQDFGNANKYASDNLQQQNQLGLQDLISQRNTDMDAQRLAETTRNNNLDNTYKYDYMNQYLNPQLQASIQNQQVNQAIERQKLAQTGFKSDLERQIVNAYNPSNEQMNNFRNTALSSPEAQIFKSRLDSGQDTPEVYNNNINNLTNSLARQEGDRLSQIYAILNNPGSLQKQVPTSEVKNTRDAKGNIISSEETIKGPANSNSVAKKTGNSLIDTVAGGVLKT